MDKQKNPQAGKKSLKYSNFITKNIIQKCNNENQQCKNFNFPCSTGAQQNQKVLKQQQSQDKEKQFELSRKKTIVMTKDIKPHYLGKINQIERYKQTKRINQTFKNNQTQLKSACKGIRLSIADKSISTAPHQVSCFNQAKIPISQFRVQNTVSAQNNNQLNQQLIYHPLNPLTIDRSKYEQKNIIIGGDRSQINNIKISYQQHLIGPKRSLNRTSKLNTTNKHNKNVKFLYTNESIYNPSHTKSVNQKNTSIYIHSLTSIKDEILTDEKRINQNISINQYKTYQQQYNPSMPQSRQIIHSKDQFIDSISSNLYQTNEIQSKYQQNPTIDEKQCQTKQFQTYSSRYKQYMQKQLSPHHIQSIFQNVNIQSYSVNQEHNQKSQNQVQISQAILKINSIPIPSRQSISSSFMVMDVQENKVQSIKYIYVPSNVNSHSIIQNLKIGIPQSIEQDFQNDRLNQQFHLYQSKKQIMPTSTEDQLRIEIQTLSSTYHTLIQEETQLKNKLQILTLQRSIELQRQVQQFETFKYLSQSRYLQIQTLKEIIKVKKIYKKFCQNQTAKSTYLQTQKGWIKYIQSEGEQYQKSDKQQSTFVTHSNNESLTLKPQ